MVTHEQNNWDFLQVRSEDLNNLFNYLGRARSPLYLYIFEKYLKCTSAYRNESKLFHQEAQNGNKLH